jgi:hypothetical protein
VQGRRELASLIVEGISVGREENGKPRVRIDYRFGVPSDASEATENAEGETTDGLTNHKTSVTPPDTPALTLVATVVK